MHDILTTLRVTSQSLFAAFTSIGNIYTALAQAVGAADKARHKRLEAAAPM